MIDICKAIKKDYMHTLLIIFLIAVLANAQALFFNTDASDSLRAYGSAQILMSLGRFVGHYLDVLFEWMGFFQPFRYINGLFYLAYTSLAVIFILLTFDIKDKIKSILIGIVIMTSAINSSILVYFYTAHMYGLSFLVSMISVYLILKKRKVVFPAVLIAISLGIYQAYFATIIMIIFLYQVVRLIRDDISIKNWILETVVFGVVILEALILYVVANKLALRLSGASLSGYLDMSENVVPSYNISQILSILKTSYTLIFTFISSSRYWFSDNIINRICIVLALLSFCLEVVIIFIKQRDNKKRVLLIALLLVLPCIINLPMFVDSRLYERICLNWYFIFIIPIILADVMDFNIIGTKIFASSKFVEYFAVIVMLQAVAASGYSTYRNINIYTSYAKANEIAQDLVDDMEHRIAACEGFAIDKELCFIGNLDTDITNGRFFNIEYSAFLYKIFNRDYSSIFKRYALLDYKYILSDDIRVVNYSLDDLINGDASINNTDEFFCINGKYSYIYSNNEDIKSMPAYPAAGCVKEVNGIIIIKLSD